MKLWLFILGLPLVGLFPLGCAATGGSMDLAGDEPTAARKLYLAKCAKCHKLYDPATYSDEEWSKWMAKMTRKAKLTPEQAQKLSRYIEESFRGHRSSRESAEVTAIKPSL